MIFTFIGSTQPNAGLSLLFPVFAAVIIGGAALSGGKGTAIGTLSGALLLAIIIKFRRKRLPATYRPPQWHSNLRLEITWTLLPFLILCVIGVPSFLTLQKDGYQGKIGLETHIFGEGRVAASHASMKEILRIVQEL